MPCDTVDVSQCADKYRDVMQALEILLNDHDDAHVVICGDWNTNPSRKNAQSEHFYAITALSLESSGIKARLYICNHRLHHRSCIDRFVMSSKVFQLFTACYVYGSPWNPSDHNYIFFSAKMGLVLRQAPCNLEYCMAQNHSGAYRTVYGRSQWFVWTNRVDWQCFVLHRYMLCWWVTSRGYQ